MPLILIAMQIVSTCLTADSLCCVVSRKPPLLLLLSSTPRRLHCFLLVPIHSAPPRTRVLRSARFLVPSLTAPGQWSVDKSPHPVVVNENHPLTHPRPICSRHEGMPAGMKQNLRPVASVNLREAILIRLSRATRTNYPFPYWI